MSSADDPLWFKQLRDQCVMAFIPFRVVQSCECELLLVSSSGTTLPHGLGSGWTGIRTTEQRYPLSFMGRDIIRRDLHIRSTSSWINTESVVPCLSTYTFRPPVWECILIARVLTEVTSPDSHDIWYCENFLQHLLLQRVFRDDLSGYHNWLVSMS